MIRNKLIMNKYLCRQGGVTNKFNFRTRVFRTLRSLTLISAAAVFSLSNLTVVRADGTDGTEEEQEQPPASTPSTHADYKSVVSGETALPVNEFEFEGAFGTWTNSSTFTTTFIPDSYKEPTSSFYYWWEENDQNNYTFHQNPGEEKPSAWGIEVKFQQEFGDNGTGQANFFSWNTIPLSSDSKAVTKNNTAIASASSLTGNGFVVYGNSASRNDDCQQSINNGIYFGQYSSDNKNAKGGAVYIKDKNFNTLTIENSTFVGNYVTGQDNMGGAIDNYGTIRKINNVTFIGNYIEGGGGETTWQSKSWGGAVHNFGNITEGIHNSNFIGNYVYVNKQGAKTPQGGAISNADDKTNPDNNQNVHIAGITGNFIGNYVLSDSSGVDTIGGAIANYGRIDYIRGTFIGNYASSPRTANSGAIRNYSGAKYLAIIGYTDDMLEQWKREGKDVDEEAQKYRAIDGVFIGNYAQGGSGSAWGGVMRNNGEIHGAIMGVYIGNYAIAEGKKVGADDGTSRLTKEPGDAKDCVAGNEYSSETGGKFEHIGHALGGVFYNTLKNVSPDSQGDKGSNKDVIIANIDAIFIDNFVQSTYSTAFGGAIFNEEATIKNIKGPFKGNHAVSISFEARGGAIYNNDFKPTEHETSIQVIGTKRDYSSNQEYDTIFTDNYAQGKAARGGAIFVSNNASVQEIYAKFDGNYTKSVMPESDYDVYDTAFNNGVDEKEAEEKNGTERMFRPTARGGAIFVADKGSIEDITGTFTYNWARTTGIGEKRNSDGTLFNDEETAMGGALFVAREAAVGNLYADFRFNTATTESTAGEDGVTKKAQGGAIYVKVAGAKSNIQNIGKDGTPVHITDNSASVKVAASSNNSVTTNATEELAQGGAIYVSTSGVIENIYANFTNNVASIDAIFKADKKLYAQGGAIFVDDEGSIKDITGSFTQNQAINKSVSKHESGVKPIKEEETTTYVQGGAIYLNGTEYNKEEGEEPTTSLGAINASFTNNQAINKSIVYQALEVQGGAVYVNEYGFIDDIIGDFSNNIAKNTGEVAGSISIQGGAVYVNSNASIEDIKATDKGFYHNAAVNEGGTINADNVSPTVRTGGGAVFVSIDASIQNIMASFEGNYASSSGTGSTAVYMRGGAILVNNGGSIKYIGFDESKEEGYYTDNDDKLISGNIEYTFKDNYVGIKLDEDTKASNNLEMQYVRGGAIFVSSHLYDDKDNTIPENSEDEPYRVSKGTIEDIAANFTGNGAVSKAGDNKKLEAYAQGGAVFVLNYGEVGNIYGNFEKNYAVTNSAANESAHGGAIDVAIGGKIASLTGDFKYNFVANSGATKGTGIKGVADHLRGAAIKKPEVTNGEETEETNKEDENKDAKGGALYLARNASVGDIHSNFIGNWAVGSGQVRAGALFVSNASIGEITGDFLGNYAHGREGKLTFGGAVRFDQAVIKELKSDFINNWTNGSGGGISLTNGGVIYEATGNYIGNTSGIDGGAVHNLGNIGLRGYLVKDYYVKDAKGNYILQEDGTYKLNTDFNPDTDRAENYRTADKDPYNPLLLLTYRDATEAKDKYQKEGGYTNKAGRSEYDGSFTGGFINSNFLYNTSYGSEFNPGTRGLGGAIFTDKHLFITSTGYKETVMSGNVVRYKEKGETKETVLRSAIYVDDKLYRQERPEESTDYKQLVIYLVAKNNGILRIDDNIRGAESEPDNFNPDDGFVLRMRGYVDKKSEEGTQESTTGLIILNNRVEQSYSIMDDVTLYVGYNVQTYQYDDYLNNSDKKLRELANAKDRYTAYDYVENGKYSIGDEDQDVVRYKTTKTYATTTDKDYSTYLDFAGKLMGFYSGSDGKYTYHQGERVEGTENFRRDNGQATATNNRADLYHQSDVFRDSHLSVRSGTVALTDTTYGNTLKSGKYNADRLSKTQPNGAEVYTEYLFGSLIAYGIDYNYGLFGTNDEDVKKLYLGTGYEGGDDAQLMPDGKKWPTIPSDPTEEGEYGKVKDPMWPDYEPLKNTRFAKFEFGIGFDKQYMYDYKLNNLYYYVDEAGKATEIYHTKVVDNEEVPNYFCDKDENPVNVIHQMATSDVLTVFAMVRPKDKNGTLSVDNYELDWTQTSKGRVTLNGLTIDMKETGWQSTRYVKGGNMNDSLGNDGSTETEPEGKTETKPAGTTGTNPEENYNLDVYVQLINYVLVGTDRQRILDNDIRKDLRDKMANAEAPKGKAPDDIEDWDPESYWNLLRLSDHFDRVDTATAVMKGSDIMAEKIELATTVTKDDSIHIVNWRDHLAEWAEYDGSTSTDNITFKDYYTKSGVYDPANDKQHDMDGEKHFYFDQSKYLLNRNINIRPNPTDTHHEATSSVMWGNNLIFEGMAKSYTLDLQGMNLLSLIVQGQNVRLQSLTLENVQKLGDAKKLWDMEAGDYYGKAIESKHNYSEAHIKALEKVGVNNNPTNNPDKKNERENLRLMQNEGNLTLDTVELEQNLIINNAGYNMDPEGSNINASLTVTGITTINNVITTADEGTNGHGLLFINDKTQVGRDTYLNSGDKTAHNGIGENEDDDYKIDSNPNDEGYTGTEPPNQYVPPTEEPNPPAKEETDPPATTITQSYIVIKGTVEKQDIVHQGSVLKDGKEDLFQMERDDVTYTDVLPPVENATDEDKMNHTTPLWKIANSGNIAKIRDSFTTNTYLFTTNAANMEDSWESKDLRYYTPIEATGEFNRFYDNSLTMEGGAFNLGHMATHRLQLRYFNISGGGAVFVDSAVIYISNDKDAVIMGGIDATNTGKNNSFSGSLDEDGQTAVKDDLTKNPEHPANKPATTEPTPTPEPTPEPTPDASLAAAQSDISTLDDGGDPDEVVETDTAWNTPLQGHDESGVGDGLIWLHKFMIAGTSNKKLIHVKFVDNQVGYAVKDGMGVANGKEPTGARYLPDGFGLFTWKVTYNDIGKGKDDFGNEVHIGYYTLQRFGYTPEAQITPVTEVTGSFLSMLKVYEYSFEHADLYSTNINEARNAGHYAGVVAGKGKEAAATCPPSTVGLRPGMWMHTYSSTETMGLNNGPDVKVQLYGGLVGGDTALRELRNGWGSVYTLYGGYLGSTQKYDTVKIKQNGAAVGATATFYKKNYYAAFTASIGTSTAEAKGRGGNEEFDMFMGGVAARMGYNFSFAQGRYVLQPSLMVSYTCFSVGDYTNAYGARIETDPTTVLQFHPFVKLIKNTDCTWKPYATVGYVYNSFSKTRVKAIGVELPHMGVDPYLEYSVGAQRTYADKYTIYGQVTGRNGGRDGFEASAGLRVAW